MNTVTGNVLPICEIVTHVAFGCGCVRTFHADHPADPVARCQTHGDTIISTTKELVPKQRSAA
jgi:hypothetical protein